MRTPAALFRARLGGRTGAGLDPCGALQVVLKIEPGQSRRLAFVLGRGQEKGHAVDLVEPGGQRLLAERLLSDPSIELLVNNAGCGASS